MGCVTRLVKIMLTTNFFYNKLLFYYIEYLRIYHHDLFNLFEGRGITTDLFLTLQYMWIVMYNGYKIMSSRNVRIKSGQ